MDIDKPQYLKETTFKFAASKVRKEAIEYPPPMCASVLLSITE